MNTHLTLTNILIYPVKSLGGISVQEAMVTKRGLAHDRRWLLVDDQGVFLSQRTFPAMVSFATSLSDTALTIQYKDNPAESLVVPFVETKAAVLGTLNVSVWDSICMAWHLSKEADAWFSERLGISCHLVYMPEESIREINPKHDRGGDIVSFADGYPILIVGTASLDDLNSRMEVAIPMDRFRTNFVFAGGGPYEEDKWKNFRIGEIDFYGVKPCSRCVMTTIDQETGEVMGSEPLTTLAKYRLKENNVYFGYNIIANQTGVLKVGDVIEIGERY